MQKPIFNIQMFSESPEERIVWYPLIKKISNKKLHFEDIYLYDYVFCQYYFSMLLHKI